MKRPSRFTLTPLVLALCLVWSSGCTVSKNPVSGKKRAYGYSWEQEVQIGREQDALVIQQFGLYDDPALQQYVDRVAAEVLAESHLRRPDTDAIFRNTEFTFRVLDSPVVNALALPGGYVYVTRGLMAHLENEAQLAVVLGHEIGHVAARHASARAAKQQLGQIGLLGGAIAGEVFGAPGVGQNVLQFGGQGLQLLFLSYSRENERESDELGVEYAALAGYDAAEGGEFFRSLQRLGARSENNIPSFLSTHPDPGEREERIPRIAEQWRAQSPMNRVEEEEYHRRLAGVVLGENPRQGYTEDGWFYHPDLRFQFPVPRGFAVANSPTQVTMYDQNQQALMAFTFAQALLGAEVRSAEDAARTLANQQGVRVLDSGTTRSGSVPAAYVLLTPEQNQNVQYLAYFLDYNGTTYAFLGATAAQNMNRYQDEFLRTMRGFQTVTDPRVLNVEPTRIDIVRASRTAPFSSFISAEMPRGMTADELAILNQVTLEETIPEGTLLKLPGQ